MNTPNLKKLDPEIFNLIEEEKHRQEENIELIASENFTSQAVMEAAGTCLTNKYAEGYPGKRYYSGCEYHDEIENLAIERLKELFGAKFANVQPHSGANANLAAFMALLNPGDTYLGMSLKEGGHLTHGSAVNFSGKWFNVVSYGVNAEGYIDYEALEQLALEHKPKMIIAGASAYPRTIDFPRFRAIADKVGAMLMVDMAHIAGLVAAGVHPSPMPYADIVTSTTHKTLRGPRGGVVLTNSEEIAKKVNSAVFPGTQGGPLMHIIAAKAVCFKEALSQEFKDYQKQVVINAKALAQTLLIKGIGLVSGGTDNHLMLLDLRALGITGKDAANVLDTCRITVNKNGVPNDPQSPFVTSGIRIGTPAVTTRGFKEPEIIRLAELIASILIEMSRNNSEISEESRSKALKEVSSLNSSHPLYPDLKTAVKS